MKPYSRLETGICPRGSQTSKTPPSSKLFQYHHLAVNWEKYNWAIVRNTIGNMSRASHEFDLPWTLAKLGECMYIYIYVYVMCIWYPQWSLIVSKCTDNRTRGCANKTFVVMMLPFSPRVSHTCYLLNLCICICNLICTSICIYIYICTCISFSLYLHLPLLIHLHLHLQS